MRNYNEFIRSVQSAVIGSILLILLAGCVVKRGIGANEFDWPDALVVHSVIENDDRLKVLWSRSNVFARSHNIGLRMAAIRRIVFILGSLTPIKDEAVLAIDGSEGELLWSSDLDTRPTLFTTTSGLFVGSSGFGGVTMYDLYTGQTLWSQRLSHTRNVRHLYVVDNTIHASSSPDIFHLLQADTGEVIQTLSYEFGREVFVSTNEVTFIQYPTLATLQAVETQSNALIWEANVKQEYLQGPVFTKDTIYVRTERELGRVYAIDRHTGDILWQTSRDVISNVAVTEARIYMLTLNGKLLGIDTGTGEAETFIQFESNPFILLDSKGHRRGYFVAVDENAGLLYVLLGDSRQLFTFRITDILEP